MTGAKKLTNDYKKKSMEAEITFLERYHKDRTLWITRFGRGYGPVVRQTTE
jgi:hypothetical protein